MSIARDAGKTLITLCLALSLAASAAEKQTAGTFRSTAELVLVPAIVTDKSGQHMRALKKEDFTLLHNGKEQRIAVFDEVRTSGAPFKKLAAIEGFTNFLPTDEARRLTIIALDMVNTPLFQQVNAREHLVRFLSDSVQSPDPTALVILGRDGVRPVHDFTVDTRVLITALKRVNSKRTDVEASTLVEPPPEAVQDLPEELQRLREFQTDPQEIFYAFQQKEAIRSTMQGLEQIAQAYAGVPGRKALIWASAGFPFLIFDPRSVAGMGTDMIYSYERVWRALNQANIAVYPVDTRFIINPAWEQQMKASYMMPPGANQRRYYEYLRSIDQQIRATFENFADKTGGKTCMGRDNLEDCFRRASEDSREYYMLGFYLDAQERKPGWHKLEVKARAERARVTARTGFYVNASDVLTPESLKLELALAIVSPLNYTSIPMQVKWTGVAVKEGKKRAEFRLMLPPGSFAIDTADRNHFSLEIAAYARNSATRTEAGEMMQNLNGNLDMNNLSKVHSGGLTYKGALPVRPGKHIVKFVVRDNLAGKLGSVAAPLEVPE